MKKILLTLFLVIPAILTAQDELSFIETMFGKEVTFIQVGVYLIMGIIGLLTSITFDLYSSGASSKDLSISYWWNDNKFRLLLSFIVVILAIIFSEQLIGVKASNWSMFLAGFTSDKIIENLIQRKRRKKQNKS